jgi:hypothetical protein
VWSTIWVRGLNFSSVEFYRDYLLEEGIIYKKEKENFFKYGEFKYDSPYFIL